MDTLFTSENCPGCRVLERLPEYAQALAAGRLRVANIDRDPGARDAFFAAGLGGVPTLLRLGAPPVVGAGPIARALRGF